MRVIDNIYTCNVVQKTYNHGSLSSNEAERLNECCEYYMLNNVTLTTNNCELPNILKIIIHILSAQKDLIYRT